MSQEQPRKHSTSSYFIIGILTVIPIGLTWLIFDFLFTQLSRIGTPLVEELAKLSPQMAKLLEPGGLLAPDSWLLSFIAVVFVLVALYLLGWIATRVIGKQIIRGFDLLMNRVPLVKTIYGSIKKLISVLQKKPDGAQRVVLIDFPSPEMKTVGFVTQILVDDDTGQKIAAVYVPTTPNPTSGYLEIVPLDKIVLTDWTMDEAMTFIVSGGAVAPDHLNYTKGVKTENAD
jgi:uncharacterized membrane protein